MLFYIYLAIAAGVLALTVWTLVTERDWRLQAASAMLTIPLLLRVLLIK
jgi:membrane-associated PAP2 superfamily phosphatase